VRPSGLYLRTGLSRRRLRRRHILRLDEEPGERWQGWRALAYVLVVVGGSIAAAWIFGAPV
jgi:hypothetical protein